MRTQFSEALNILGVDILDVTLDDAVSRMRAVIENWDGTARSVYFVNAHTLNTAVEDNGFQRTLNAADFVFGDGTGVRWAARYVHGLRLKDNVNGTDFVPRFFASTAGNGYKYFLLGATPEAIARAANKTQELFPGWTLAGFHHGYLDANSETQIIDTINASGAQLLLVGMGNPLQERFIERHRHNLRIPLLLGVGGLFTYWSGDLQRAPLWVRRLGYEWLHLLLAQPHKFKRYVFGNPQFLGRVARSRKQKGLRMNGVGQ